VGFNMLENALLALLMRYLANCWMEFHQTLVVGVLEIKDELIIFEGRGFCKVKVTAKSYIKNL